MTKRKKMLRNRVAWLCAISLILSLVYGAAASADRGGGNGGHGGNISVAVNGQTVSFALPPAKEEGTIMVSAAELFEAMQVKYTFNANTQTLKAKKNGKSLLLRVGQRTARMDGIPVVLERMAYLKDGRLVIPADFVTDSFEAQSTWDPGRKKLSIAIEHLPDEEPNTDPSVFTPKSGEWNVQEEAYSVKAAGALAHAIKTDAQHQNFNFEATVRMTSQEGPGSWVGLSFRSGSDSEINGYLLYLDTTGGLVLLGADGQPIGGSQTGLNVLQQDIKIKVAAANDSIKVYVNNSATAAIDVTDTSFATGYAGIACYAGECSFNDILVRNVVVTDSVFTPKQGDWQIQDEVYRTVGSSSASTATKMDRTYSDLSFEATIQILDNFGQAGMWGGVNFRKQNASALPFSDGYLLFLRDDGSLILYTPVDGVIGQAGGLSPMEEPVHVKVTAVGDRIRVYVNHAGTPAIDVVNDTYQEGYVGLGAIQAVVEFSDIAVSEGSDSPLPSLEFTAVGGSWSVTEDVYRSAAAGTALALNLAGKRGDFTLNATLRLLEGSTEWGGLMLRKQGAQFDFADGYLLAVNTGGQLILYDLSSPNPFLAVQSLGLDPLQSDLRLKVVAKGPRLRVYVNDSETAAIDVTDAKYAEGYIGLATSNAATEYSNISIP